MIALTLESAKTIAIVVVIVFVALSVISALVIKNIVTKLIMVVLMACLALGVWTQRTSLKECADRAQAKAEALDASGLTCTFFGTDIEVG
jgi:protein-S-isoprenylcysteine O-methyltransferase Ste14